MNAMKKLLFIFSLIFIFAQISAVETFAQKTKKASKKVSVAKSAKKPNAVSKNNTLPKVTAVDDVALKNLLNRTGENAKPLLINFWATWCDPCREEFPDLVKLDADYKGKIDFITISLDDVEDIKTTVPRFLAEMKAEMPAYLLSTDSEEAAIGSVSKDWQGGLPFTVLLNNKGEITYLRQGKVIIEVLRAEIEKLTPNQP